MTSVPENRAFASGPDLSPLALQREGDVLRFTIRTQDDILAQLPEDYERLLSERLAAMLAEPGSLHAEIDLEELPGINSRQLGALIALEKVVRGRFGTLPIRNASPAVRHLLKLTRTDRLFTVS